jgi:nucleotide-binding universal stress UspA family protein
MFKKILVPVDGSATANLGLRHAIRLAKNQRATLTILHVVDESAVLRIGAMDGGAYLLDDMIKGLVESGKKLVSRALETARKQGVRARSVLVEKIGQPVANVIVRQAKKVRADLIVIGTHGRRGVARVVMGSDAEGVLRQATVPVVLVRLPGAGRKRK